MTSRDPKLTQLSDPELELRFVEAERNALEWSGQGFGRHAQHQGTRWMEIVASCGAEMARRAAGGAIEPPTPSRIPGLLAELAACKGVIARPPATAAALRELVAWRADVPPSYLELLAIHDGIAGCFGNRGELVSSAYREIEFDGQFIIIAVDRVGNGGAAFDSHEDAEDGELPVYEWRVDQDSIHHSSLEDFLAKLVARMR